MRFLLPMIVLIAMPYLSACYTAPVKPPQGYVYSRVTAPLDSEVGGTPLGSQRGEASSIAILGLVAFGDASVDAAARNGGLNQVDHLDYEFFNILGIYQRFTTIATGS